MPVFQMRFANRSNPGAVQDWILHGTINQQFQLQPDHVSGGNLTINQNGLIQIAVDTNLFAAADLAYTAATNTWTLNSNTPNEFALAAGGGIVTVRCFLGNGDATSHSKPQYEEQNPKHEVSDPS